MKLFHWDRIETVEGYGLGDLIVMAETEDQAREIGHAALTAKARETWDYFFDAEGEPLDRDFAEMWQEKVKLVDADMRATPLVVESCAVCIRGSD